MSEPTPVYVYIDKAAGRSSTKQLAEGINADYGSDGALFGVEIYDDAVEITVNGRTVWPSAAQPKEK